MRKDILLSNFLNDHKFCVSLIAFLLFGFLILCTPGRVSAATATYPSEADKYIVSSMEGNGIYLDAPTSYIKINFDDAATVYKVHLINVCWSSLGGIDGGNTKPAGCAPSKVKITICGSTSTGEKDTSSSSSCWSVDAYNYGNDPDLYFSCSGCGQGGTQLPAPKHDTSWRSIYVMVQQQVSGLNGWKIQATGYTNSSLSTETGGTRIGFGKTVSEATYYPQSLMYLPMNGSTTQDISVAFKVPCSFTGTSFQVKWFDADRYPSTTPYDPNISWSVTNVTQNLTQDASLYAFFKGQNLDTYLGGQGDQRSETIADLYGAPININQADLIRWDWKNVKGNNGVQFLLPFSEADIGIECSKVVIDNACPGGATATAEGWAFDPQLPSASVQVKVYIDLVEKTGDVINSPIDANISRPDVNSAFGISGNHGWKITIPNSYLDGNTHYLSVVAVGINAGGAVDGANSPIATRAFSCSSPITISCEFSPRTVEENTDFDLTVTLTASGASSNSINNTSNSLTVSLAQNGTNIFNPTGYEIYGPNPFGLDPNIAFYPVSPATARVTNNTTGDITVSASLQGYGNLTGCNMQTIKVVRQPYLSFYGGDICSKTGAVTTFNYTGSPDYRGSGSQLATFAADTISGYTTAKMRANDLASQKSLAFANEASNFGKFSSLQCIDVDSLDYDTPTNATNWPGISNALASGTYKYGTASNTSTMSGGQIPNGKQVTLYINGNLAINGNITYSNSYTNLSEIPSFTVIVNGNIYIDNDVSELNGTFIARGSSGKIYTCADATGSTPQTDPYLFGNLGSNCDNTQLKVYGALYGKEIRWFRTINSLKDGSASEGYTTSKAAEVIVDGPFRYYPHPSSSTRLDAITSLSPIL